MDECDRSSNTDNILLYDQENHRSQNIINGAMGAGLLSCRSKGGLLGRPCNDVRVLRCLHVAGFYGLYKVGNVRLDWPLITALVERFRHETHTIHLPPGECTVTLQDVQILLGLRINGPPVIGVDGRSQEDWINMIDRLLGKRPKEEHFRGGRISISWLNRNFKKLSVDADDTAVLCYSRAIILKMLGGHYFSDKSSSHAWLLYLPLLEDLELCGRYSWGSSILAFLYREMCVTSNRNSTTIVGPLILLQLWAWSRLTQIRPQRFELPPFPKIDPPSDGGVPLPLYTLGYRWTSVECTGCLGVLRHDLLWYRDQFDQTLEEQIIWEPYKDLINSLPTYCFDSKEIWKSQVPLMYYHIVEYHYPDRVLRQFGEKQMIPVFPLKDKKHLLTRQGKGITDWAKEHKLYMLKWSKIRDSVISGEIHCQPLLADDPYVRWYRKNTLLRITPFLKVPPAQGFNPTGGRDAMMATYIMTMYDKVHSPSFDLENFKKFMNNAIIELKLDPKSVPRLSDSDTCSNSEPVSNSNPDSDWGLFDGIIPDQHDTTNVFQMELEEIPPQTTYGHAETPSPYTQHQPETPVETPAPHTQDKSETPAPRMRNIVSICRDDSLVRHEVAKKGIRREKKRQKCQRE